MTRSCVVCGAPADVHIPAGRVCRDHAIEFYTGLLAFAVNRDREVIEVTDLPRVTAPVGPRPRRSYVKRSAYWKTMQPEALAV